MGESCCDSEQSSEHFLSHIHFAIDRLTEQVKISNKINKISLLLKYDKNVLFDKSEYVKIIKELNEVDV